ncbi:MAG: hypothetical protein ACTSX1_10185 [Candidatus Heimdallarchaeaceae archaeon]
MAESNTTSSKPKTDNLISDNDPLVQKLLKDGLIVFNKKTTSTKYLLVIRQIIDQELSSRDNF